MAGRRVCGKCRARSTEPQPPLRGVSRGKEGNGNLGAQVPWRGRGTGSTKTKRHEATEATEASVPWQLQHMAITCEDAVRRIDELCALTQHLLKDLDLGYERPMDRYDRSYDQMNPTNPTNPMDDQRQAGKIANFQAPVPLLPGYRASRDGEAPITEAPTQTRPEVPGNLEKCLSLLLSHTPAPLGTKSVMLPCDRCIDLDAFSSQFSSTLANWGQRRRIAEELQTGQLYRRICGIYSRLGTDLTWSHGRLRDFVRCCFADLALQSPTEPQMYEVYSHFDPELRLGTLSPLESICLIETLLRATFHEELGDSEALPLLSASAVGQLDHPTKLAEKWVEDYVPLPVDGTVSIAYSTGVVIQFSEFTSLLQPLAAANVEHREQMLKMISSCQLLKHGLQIFQRFDSGTGYLAWPDGIMDFISAVFGHEGYVLTPSQQVFFPFVQKFAQGKPKLNTSECLCLIDAICRAMLHCDGKFGVGKSEILGTTASTTCSDGKVPDQPQTSPQGQGTAKAQADFPQGQGLLPEFAAMTNEVNELQVAQEIERRDPPKAEPKALMAARSWVETAAKDLPAFNIDGHGGHGGHGDVGHIVSSMGPQQFASLTLRIYCEHFAGKERLYYRGPEEVQDFIRVVFHSGGITLSSRLVQMAMGAVAAVAEQIDLNNLGYLDITQCLLLADGVLRWILTTVSPPTRKDSASTGSLPYFGGSIFLQPLQASEDQSALGSLDFGGIGDGKTSNAKASRRMVIQRLSKNVADGMCQDIRSVDATSQVFREAFAACDQGSHGYLTWSEVKHFVTMVFNALGAVH
eukprot:symbB.v1.2.012550.t1/scaffold819.1/size162441/21